MQKYGISLDYEISIVLKEPLMKFLGHTNKCFINHTENVSRYLEETTFVGRLMFFLFGRDRKGRKMRWLTMQST